MPGNGRFRPQTAIIVALKEKEIKRENVKVLWYTKRRYSHIAGEDTGQRKKCQEKYTKSFPGGKKPRRRGEFSDGMNCSAEKNSQAGLARADGESMGN